MKKLPYSILFVTLAASSLFAQTSRRPGRPIPHPRISSTAAPAQASPVPLGVNAMHLLTPDQGWVSAEGRLLVTGDSGEHWREITPAQGGGFEDVFFTSLNNAWVLYQTAKTDEDRAEDDTSDWGFQVARTTDGGATWSVCDVPLVRSTNEPNGHASFAFADAMHGWLLYGLSTGSAFSSGVLLETRDGGGTWNQPASAPGFNGSLMVAPGGALWAVGGAAGDDQLVVSRDGANSFTDVEMPAPKEVAHFDNERYDTPSFTDAETGSIVVSFSHFDTSTSDQVLFRTGDGGKTWRLAHVLHGATEGGGYVFGQRWIDLVPCCKGGFGRRSSTPTC